MLYLFLEEKEKKLERSNERSEFSSQM